MRLTPPDVRFGDRLDFDPSRPPSDEKERWLRQGADLVRSEAESAVDFFRTSDNGPTDQDPKPGHVVLSQASSPDLIGDKSRTVSGSLTPGGDLALLSQNFGRLQVETEDGRTAILSEKRAIYNDRYLDSVDYVAENADGTITYVTGYVV